jgi:hypothetical protein
MIDEINADFARQRKMGYYDYRRVANQLRVWPRPEISGENIYITYMAPHVLNEGGDGYDTIPDEDLSILRDLTLAEMLQSYRMDGAMDIGWTIGLVREDPQGRLPAIQNAIAEFRNSVKRKYQRPVGLLG